MGVLFEHRLRIGGYETRALELDGEGPPLLLLHGWGDSADTWRAVLDRLRRRGRRATALDMPGFGTASRLSNDGAVLPQLDRFVRAALISVGDGEPAVICGNSLGGCVSLRAAENDDLEIAGVVPIAPAGLELARWVPIIEGEPMVRAVLRSPLPVPRPIVRQVVGELYRRLAFADTGRIEPGAVASFCSHIETRQRASEVLAIGRRLRPEMGDAFHLDRVRCPLLVIWGDRDRMVPVSGTKQIVEQLPDARIEVLEGYGHCPQVEAADRVTELVADFSLEAASAPAR